MTVSNKMYGAGVGIGLLLSFVIFISFELNLWGALNTSILVLLSLMFFGVMFADILYYGPKVNDDE